MDTAPQTTGLIILFDDERSFQPGFRDGALTLRTVKQARNFFEGLKGGEQRISELWLDFVLNPGNSYEALYSFPGELLDRAIYHSRASGGHSLLATFLQESGFEGTLELPELAFPGADIFPAE